MGSLLMVLALCSTPPAAVSLGEIALPASTTYISHQSHSSHD
jgi:hypothetical protein